MDRAAVLALLAAHSIPLEQWGTGEAKTLENLFNEIESGEATLAEKDGMLLRFAEGCTVRVYYRRGDTLLYLREDRQVFKDGRKRVRDLDTSIGEKMRRGEDPAEAACRALSEELGLAERPDLAARPMFEKGPTLSQSFPGLQTLYRMHVFHVFLPPHLFKPEGYVEEQADKNTYFVWTRVDFEARA